MLLDLFIVFICIIFVMFFKGFFCKFYGGLEQSGLYFLDELFFLFGWLVYFLYQMVFGRNEYVI